MSAQRTSKDDKQENYVTASLKILKKIFPGQSFIKVEIPGMLEVPLMSRNGVIAPSSVPQTCLLVPV